MPRLKNSRRQGKQKSRKEVDLSAPSRANKVSLSNMDGTYPSKSQFKSFAPRTEFKVSYMDGDESVTFRKGQTALLAPKDYKRGVNIPTHTYYAAEIVDIRENMKSKHGPDIWVMIKWFYSAEDPETRLNPTGFGLRERLKSDHHDIEHAQSFEMVIHMHFLDERSINPPHIGPQDWFYRHTFDFRTKEFIPGCKPTCLCGDMFDPEEPSSEGVMHFCPRPLCRKSYHARCLSHVTRITNSLNAYLESSPDSNEAYDLTWQADCRQGKIGPERTPKRQRANSSRKVKFEEISADHSVPDRLAQVGADHPDLIKIARCPIVRGKAAGGPSGNIRDVIAARRLVYALLEGAPFPEDWDSRLSVRHALDVYTKIKSLPRHEAPFACPSCGGAI